MAADNQPPPAQPMEEPALLALARKQFGALSHAEEELFRAAQEGRAASALDPDENENDPASATNWAADRVVRAKCVVWVCTDPQASVLLTHRGLDLLGMRIDGDLDLDYAEIKFPLRAMRCAFSRHISLQYAQLRGFYLVRCQTKSLHAGGTQFKGSVLLRDGFRAEGEVNLAGTKIDGDLDCRDAQFSNTKGLALNANGAKIERYVFLRRGFKAEGGVNLIGAMIGGGLQIREVADAEGTVFDLRLAKVGAFWDDDKSWPGPGNLFIDGFRYERLYEKAPFEADSRKKWLSLQPRDKFRPQPYEQLAAVLRQMGHEPDAREVMIEKNRERARFIDFPHQSWWWYNLFGKLIGYGYRPWRAFALSVAMILLGTFLFHLGATHGLISPTSENAYAKAPNGHVIEENEAKKVSEDYPTFHAFIYSLESFTPLLKLDQSAHWTPNANHGAQIPLLRLWVPRSGELLRYYLYFHIAAGWLLTSLWVGAITGLVKT